MSISFMSMVLFNPSIVSIFSRGVVNHPTTVDSPMGDPSQYGPICWINMNFKGYTYIYTSGTLNPISFGLKSKNLFFSRFKKKTTGILIWKNLVFQISTRNLPVIDP